VAERSQPGETEPSRRAGSLGEVARVFLKLGVIGFGGPAAHIAMMRREVVERRRWVDERGFLDLFAASNLLPGPSSTEMAIFLGYERAGWVALLLAGTLFILPAALIVGVLAWAYVRFGSLPQTGWVLYGITPVVIAIIADAVLEMGRAAVKNLWLVALGLAVFVLALLHLNVLALLFGGAALVMLVRNRDRIGARGRGAFAPLWALAAPAGTAATAAFSMLTLFLTFLKVGAVVFGSGYVLLVFLRADLVTNLHWLTDRQLIDAVAVGQVTPGPLFTTATFIGYLTGGVLGAVVATVAIFLPGFLFVAVAYRFLPRIRRSPWARAFLDGATVSALGLMAAVTVELARAVIVDAFTAVLPVVAFLVLRRFRVNSAWLVLGGGVAGMVAKLVVRL
jgi:chromate transporter